MVVDEKLVLVYLHWDFQLIDLRECKSFFVIVFSVLEIRLNSYSSCKAAAAVSFVLCEVFGGEVEEETGLRFTNKRFI